MAILVLLPFFCATVSGNSASDKASAVDALFREYDRPGVPGACVLVIKQGKVLYKKAYGLANLEEKIATTTETNYRLASVTKQFTAMSIMILAERGRLSHESKLTDFFPDFPAYSKQITIRHLLTHTSGVADYEDLIPEGTTAQLKDQQVLDLVKQQKDPLFRPGSRFRYSNSGYALLALIVEKASGELFPEFLRKNIFEPLGMSNTVAYEEGVSVVPNRAYGYSQGPNGFQRKDQSLTSAVLGDGGIYSSVEDLYRWDQALDSARLVSRETLTQAFTPGAMTSHDGRAYGFGWFIETYRGLQTVWHYGSTVGFGTAIERFPDRKFTVIVLINRDEADAHQLARKVVDLYLFNARSNHRASRGSRLAAE
jgi:CubicO group peptidase (beta-lactamase class C family)